MTDFYLIKRTDQGGGYVAPSGSLRAYTRNPAQARRFETFEEAEAERCPGNEIVVRGAEKRFGHGS